MFGYFWSRVFFVVIFIQIFALVFKMSQVRDINEQIEQVIQLLDKNYDLSKQTPYEIIYKLVQNNKNSEKYNNQDFDNQLSQSQLYNQQQGYLDENLICSLSQTIAAKEKEFTDYQNTQNSVLQQKDDEIQELRKDLQQQKESVERYEQQLLNVTSKMFQLELSSQDTQKKYKTGISQTKVWPVASQEQVQSLKQYAYQLHCLSLTSCQSSTQYSGNSSIDKLNKPQIEEQSSKIKSLELSQSHLRNAIEQYQIQIRELQEEVVEANKKMVHYMNLYNEIKYQ